MKKSTLYLSFLWAITGLIIVPQPVLAQSAAVSTDAAAVDKIRSNCAAVRLVVRRIHTNDMLVRVNVGQSYNVISSKLMARFNSRAVLSQVDSTELVRLANDFEKMRKTFNSNFNTYESALTKLMRINCEEDSARFYDKLVEAREARAELRGNTQTMNELIVQYKKQVEKIKSSLTEGKQGE